MALSHIAFNLFLTQVAVLFTNIYKLQFLLLSNGTELELSDSLLRFNAEEVVQNRD